MVPYVSVAESLCGSRTQPLGSLALKTSIRRYSTTFVVLKKYLFNKLSIFNTDVRSDLAATPPNTSARGSAPRRKYGSKNRNGKKGLLFLLKVVGFELSDCLVG